MTRTKLRTTLVGAERERCAKVCEDLAREALNAIDGDRQRKAARYGARAEALLDAAGAIRKGAAGAKKG